MPVRSLNSRVLKWPKADVVVPAVREWAQQTGAAHPEVARIGYFGSYARGNWGVGSDLDLVILAERVEQPWERRTLPFDTRGLPVPADLLVYTPAEFEAMQEWSGFARTIRREAVWVWEKIP